VTLDVLIPSLGSRVKVLPEVYSDEVYVKMKAHKAKNVIHKNKVNNEILNNNTGKKPEYTIIIKHICTFLTARDLNHCIAVSKNFNACITTYLETYTPYFGIIDFTKQLEKYRPEIEQISDQEKIVTVQNPNPNEETEIMFHIHRENFYFPFTLEFSQIPILLNSKNGELTLFNRYTIDFKKLTFSPRTNTIFVHSLESVKFKSISKIKFKLSPVQEIENSVVTFKYKVEDQKCINDLQKCIKKRNISIFVIIFCFFVWYVCIAVLFCLINYE
jgi:hypothetical protein